MSAHANPDIIDDGLVFMYDTDDGKSYKGEPTVNVVANPLPTSGWSTANAQGSAITRTYLEEDGKPFMRFSAVTNGNDYPRVTNSVFANSATITGTFSTSLEVRGTAGAVLRFRIYQNGSTKITNSITLTSEWTRYTFDNQTTGFNLNQPYFNPATSNATYDIRNIQVEAKGHSTQFVDGTRSATQGLLDRTGNETINLSDVSFNSNSEMIFDGTDDFIPLVDNPQNGENSVSWEFITKFDLVHDNETSTYRQLYIQESSVWIGQYYDYIGIDIAKDNGSWFDGNGGRVTSSKIGPVNSGEYYHVVFTWDGTNVKGYLNSELGFTTAISGLTGIRNGVTPRRIGRRSGNPLIGEMPIVKLYNRALTAAEVLQNFNATKSRFGL